MTTELMKPCIGCKGEFPATPDHFNRRHESYDGLSPRCKACSRKACNTHRLTAKGRVATLKQSRQKTDRARLFPSVMAVVTALIHGRPEQADRLAKVAYLAVQKAGLS